MDALVIDAFEFCRLEDRREGQFAVADLPRLAKEVVGESGLISWSLQGGSDHFGHAQLSLQISGTVKLACQRCLGALEFDMASNSVLVIAKSDEDADRIEEMLADDEIDVIVGLKAMPITDMIEDEALLSIPLSVKHDVCPATSLAVSDAQKKPSAFDALKALKL